MQHRAGPAEGEGGEGAEERGVSWRDLVAGWLATRTEGMLSLTWFWVSADATEGGGRAVKQPAGGASVISSVWGGEQVTGAEPRSEPELRGGGSREKRSEQGEEQPGALGPSGWSPVVTSDSSDSSGVWARSRPPVSKFSKRKLLTPHLGHEMLCKEGNS